MFRLSFSWLLFLPLLSACDSSKAMIRPYEIRLPNPGIEAELQIKVESVERVLAILRLTNTTNKIIWLYKPVLCEGAWEESYFVMNPNNGNQLDFVPLRTEKHIEAYPETLITGVIPQLIDSLYVKLGPGQTHIVQTNLSEAFDFTGLHGEYWAIYGGRMPFMHGGKQLYQLDSAYTQLGPLPAYFHISSADQVPEQPDSVTVTDPYRSYLYVHFILP